MTSSPLLDDHALIQAIQQGDSTAFSLLYRRHWRPLYGMALKGTRDAAEAKDLLQDIFADLWQRREQLDPAAFTTAYLYASLRHKLLDRIRRQAVRNAYATRIAREVSLDHQTESGVLARDLTQHLHHLLADLPARCQLIFRLSRFEHQSPDEIADQLRLSPQTVKNQLSKALARLRARLPEYASVLLLISLGSLR